MVLLKPGLTVNVVKLPVRGSHNSLYTTVHFDSSFHVLFENICSHVKFKLIKSTLKKAYMFEAPSEWNTFPLNTCSISSIRLYKHAASIHFHTNRAIKNLSNSIRFLILSLLKHMFSLTLQFR